MLSYFSTKRGELINGNCIDILKELEPKSVDMCITSPPYWGLRSYLSEYVKLKKELTSTEIEYVMNELEKYGIKAIINE